MSLQIILKNSSVSGQEPTASQLANGELALNYHADGPFISCKDTAGVVRRIAGVWISTTAPTSPQPGEFWLDTNTTPAKLKVYKDSTDTWIDTIPVPVASTTTAGIVELATNLETQTGADTLRAVTPASLQSKISDSTSTTSSTTIASSTAVKAAKDVADAALPATGGTISGNLTVSGDLTVNGTTTTIDTTTLIVEDKNIEMGAVATPTDTTADGGGITLKGTTDKTLNWVNSTDSWTSSENVDLASGKTYKIAGTDVLSATALGSGVTGSSLTSVGTITSGTWNGTQIATNYIADGAITSDKIADGTIVNADVNASAAIAGTKISPDFGSQNVSTTGTSTAASFIPTGNTAPTNGVYLPSANNVAISANSAGKLFINSNGNVGIGVTTALSGLHVYGAGPTTANIADSDDRAAFLRVSQSGSAAGAGGGILFSSEQGDNADSAGFAAIKGLLSSGGGNTVGDLAFSVRSTTGATALQEAMRIDKSGRLGLGTSTVGAKLHIASNSSGATPSVNADDLFVETNGNTGITIGGSTSSSCSIRFADSASSSVGGIYYDHSTDAFDFATAGLNRLRITSDGKLGLGTSAPTVALHVATTGTPQFRLEDLDTANAYVNVSASNGNFVIQADPQNVSGSTRIGFEIDGFELARIDSSGRLGLGTSAPSTLLHLNSSSNNMLFLESSDSIADIIGADTVGSTRIRSQDGFLSFWTGGDASSSTAASASERARIDDSGRLGLGTNSPAELLHISSTTADAVAQVETTFASGNARLNLYANSGGVSQIRFGDEGSVNVGLLTYDHTTDAMAFRTNGNERARIDSSGRLLVGTSTSTTVTSFTTSNGSVAFTEQQRTESNTGVLYYRTSASTLGPRIYLAKSRGTSIVEDDDNLGQIEFGGFDATNTLPAALIRSEVDGDPGANDMPGRLVFFTTADGASSPTEALRITNDRVVAYNQPNVTSKSAAATLTIAELKTGIIQYTGAAATLTLPTGTLSEGGFSGIYNNMTFEWSVINTGSGTCTIGAGTGHTIVGGTTVAAGASGRFASRRTAANTFVTYRLS